MGMCSLQAAPAGAGLDSSCCQVPAGTMLTNITSHDPFRPSAHAKHRPNGAYFSAWRKLAHTGMQRLQIKPQSLSVWCIQNAQVSLPRWPPPQPACCAIPSRNMPRTLPPGTRRDTTSCIYTQANTHPSEITGLSRCQAHPAPASELRVYQALPSAHESASTKQNHHPLEQRHSCKHPPCPSNVLSSCGCC